MNINAWPLTWPAGWKRHQGEGQREAGFRKYDKRLTLTQGLERVLIELERIGVDRQDVIVSTDVRTRLNGMPRSGEPEPKDHGAAVYWQDRRGARRVMAIDQYDKVADNLAAIAATLDAMRAIERHGGAAILERAFTGFTALPAPGQTVARPWWDVLGVPKDAPRDAITAAYSACAASTTPTRAAPQRHLMRSSGRTGRRRRERRQRQGLSWRRRPAGESAAHCAARAGLLPPQRGADRRA